MDNNNIKTAQNTLRLTLGLLVIIIGIDKFFNFFVAWDAYLLPSLAVMLPAYITKVSAIFEILIGILTVNPRTSKLGAILIFLWLLFVTIQVALIGIYDVALRDLALVFCALALIKLEKTN